MLPPISFHFEVDFWASQSSRTNAHMNRSEWPKTSRHDRPVRSRIIWHVVLWKTLSDLFKKPKVSDWDWRLHWNLLWHWTYFYLGGLSQIEKILSHSGRVFRDVVSAHEVRMQVIRNFLLLEVQVRESTHYEPQGLSTKNWFLGFKTRHLICQPFLKTVELRSAQWGHWDAAGHHLVPLK